MKFKERMKDKKIFIGFLFLVIIFLISTFVSAKHAWWHPWGEPQFAPFNATVTIQGLAPTIPRVFNVSDDFISSPVDQVQPTADDASNVYVTFLADDQNGAADLPTTPSVGVAGDVNINITYGGVRPTTTSYIASAASPPDTCIQLSCNLPACNSATQRMYFCNLSASMQFYYEPNITPANPNLWTVGITIRDLSGGQIGRNNTVNFTYLQLPAVQNIVNLTWIGISPGVTNQKSTDNVTLINKGNLVINNVNVTSYNLTGFSRYPASPFAYIPSSAIRASGSNAFVCSVLGTTLFERAGLPVGNINLDYGPSVQTPLRFCIFPALNTLPGPLDLTDSAYIAFGFDPGPPAAIPNGRADWRLQL